MLWISAVRHHNISVDIPKGHLGRGDMGPRSFREIYTHIMIVGHNSDMQIMDFWVN